MVTPNVDPIQPESQGDQASTEGETISTKGSSSVAQWLYSDYSATVTHNPSLWWEGDNRAFSTYFCPRASAVAHLVAHCAVARHNASECFFSGRTLAIGEWLQMYEVKWFQQVWHAFFLFTKPIGIKIFGGRGKYKLHMWEKWIENK